MSVEVMTMVFRRYPRGGNERLLALAIADQASPDGTRIFPSVGTLAVMSAQSERSVQRLLHEMLTAGWLLLVKRSSGRRGDTNEYRISPEWIAGGDPVAPVEAPDRRTIGKVTGDKLAPVQPVDRLSTTGDTQGLSGDTQGLSGDTAVSPNPVIQPVITRYPLTPVGTGDCGKPRSPETRNSRTRPPWRWRDSFDGYKHRGEQLGIPYALPPGTSWTDDELTAHQRAYRELIDATHAQSDTKAATC